MKKSFACILCLLLVFSLVGCGSKKQNNNNNNEQSPSEPATPTVVESTPTEPEVTPSEPVIVEPEITIPDDNSADIEALTAIRDELIAYPDSLKKTEDIHEINSQIIKLNKYDFSGMKVTCIGDSVTYGTGGELDENGTPISYVNYLREALGCQVVNLGVGGSTIGTYGGDQNMYYRIEQIPSDSDIIVVFGGVNDFMAGGYVYGADRVLEDGTYYGDVKRFFARLREYFPNAEIYVVFTYQTNWENSEKFCGYYPLDHWLDVQREYFIEYNFHKIEMYRTGFMNSKIPEINSLYFYDGLHPNNDGYRLIGKYIAAKIIEDYN